MPAKCSQCGGDFNLSFELPEEITQERVDAMNMVCGKCTPDRMRDIKGDDFDKITRVGSALGRFHWLYGYDYAENSELEEIMQAALEVSERFSPYLDRLEELDREKCRGIHEMCWGKKEENENEGDDCSDGN